MKKTFSHLFVISFIVLGLFGCKEDKKDKGKDENSIESVTCSEHEVSIFRGYTTAVNVTVLPEDAEDKSFSWTVADETIAKFKDDNTILGVNVGVTWAYAISNAKPEVKDSVKIKFSSRRIGLFCFPAITIHLRKIYVRNTEIT